MFASRSWFPPLVLVVLGLGALGCSRGVGATCQYKEDCDQGLFCCNGGLPRATSRGTCQRSCDEVSVDDAATPIDASATGEDAWSSIDAAPSTPDAVSAEGDAASPSDDAEAIGEDAGR